MCYTVEVLCLLLATQKCAWCTNAEQELFKDLFYDYEVSMKKFVRPVKDASKPIQIQFGAAFVRLIDMDEKNQVLTTNLWLELRWIDWHLHWRPNQYGNITKIHIPVSQIWIPDIVLYTNAAGNPQITVQNDAVLYYDGLVVWKPPAIYKSFCEVDIKFFPYDHQVCTLKYGAWSHDAYAMDIVQLEKLNQTIIYEQGEPVQFVMRAMDLSYYYTSEEWDLLNLTSARHEVIYAGCCGAQFYVDITFTLEIRRKALFYTVNLTIPCILIAFLTTFVFYLSDHKITFAISIFVTLTFFLLTLFELIPPNAIVIPLMGKYLLFTMILVTSSICITVGNLNIYHRRLSTHPNMPRWVRRIFLEALPPYLFLKSISLDLCPEADETDSRGPPMISLSRKQSSRTSMRSSLSTQGLMKLIRKKSSSSTLINRVVESPTSDGGIGHEVAGDKFAFHRRTTPPRFTFNLASNDDLNGGEYGASQEPSPNPMPTFFYSSRQNVDSSCVSSPETVKHSSFTTSTLPLPGRHTAGRKYSSSALRQRFIITRMLDNVNFIAEHFRMRTVEDNVAGEWRFLAMVIDRIFFIIFTIINLVGTFSIILEAPALRDTKLPLAKLPPQMPLSGEGRTLNESWYQ